MNLNTAVCQDAVHIEQHEFDLCSFGFDGHDF
jgi:hypothetical protein